MKFSNFIFTNGNFYRFLKIPPIRIKTGLGHLSSFQISSLRKGFTLESNTELPQFPGFTNPLVCQIQFAVTLHSIAISVHFATLPSSTQYYTMWPRTVSIPMTFSMFLQSLVHKFWRGRAKMEQDSITALTLLFFHGVGNTTVRLPGLCPAGTFILKWLIHWAWESTYGTEIFFTYFTVTWKKSTDLCIHYRISFHSQHRRSFVGSEMTRSAQSLGGKLTWGDDPGVLLRPCLSDDSTQALPFVDTRRLARQF